MKKKRFLFHVTWHKYKQKIIKLPTYSTRPPLHSSLLHFSALHYICTRHYRSSAQCWFSFNFLFLFFCNDWMVCNMSRNDVMLAHCASVLRYYRFHFPMMMIQQEKYYPQLVRWIRTELDRSFSTYKFYFQRNRQNVYVYCLKYLERHEYGHISHHIRP